MQYPSFTLPLALAIVILHTQPKFANAQVDFRWNDPNGGSFNDPGNWQSFFPGAVPDVFVRTVFDLPQSYTVAFPQNEHTNSNSVRNGNVVFDLQGNTLAHGNLFVGEQTNDIGELTLINGTVDAGPTTLGEADSTFGALIIGGSASLDTDSVRVGHHGAGQLQVRDGGEVSTTQVLVGSELTGFGTIEVSGVSGADRSKLTASRSISIGQQNGGSLVIDGGALVESNPPNFDEADEIGLFPAPTNNGGLGAVGRVFVQGTAADGTPSSWLSSGPLLMGNVAGGSYAQGFLTITSGGQVQHTEALLLSDSEAPNHVEIKGTDTAGNPSRWTLTDGQLDLIGELEVTDGGNLSANKGTVIGWSTDRVGRLVVSGASPEGVPSSYTGAGITVGSNGSGELLVTDGGFFSAAGLSSSLNIATRSTSHGAVLVAGRDNLGNPSILELGRTLSIGREGGATLTVVDGGILRSGFDDPNSVGLVAFRESDEAVEISISDPGSSWLHANNLFFGGTASAVGRKSTFSVSNRATVDIGGTLRAWNGTNLQVYGGTLSAGILELTSGSRVQFGIGGTQPGVNFGQLLVGDDAFLDGSLDIALLGGFVPSPTDTFVILDATDLVSDTFENVLPGSRVLTTDRSGSFHVDYGTSSPFDSSQIVLSDFAINTLTADVDGDLDIDGNDLLIIQRSNPALIYEWQTQYGTNQTLAASQTIAVPEPSTWALLLLGAAALLPRRETGALLLVLMVCSPRPATAQFGGIREWTNRNGGDYTQISNWNPFSVPTADQAAIFPLDNEYTVNFPSSATTGDVLISRGNVTFDLRPSTVSRTLIVPNTLILAGEHDAKLTILDGTVTAGNVLIRQGGELEFDHAITLESILNVSGNLEIDGGRFGRFGGDKLNLSPGSDITIRNQGTFASSSHHVHQDSTVQISGGSAFAHSRLHIAGEGATGDGTVHVDGAGSFVKTGFSSVEHVWGVEGHDAIINVTGGARLQVDGDLSLAAHGFGSVAQITVAGQDSQFQFPDVGAILTLGSDGSGSASINVSNGGLFRHVGGAGNSQVLINRSGQVNVTDGGVFEARNVEFDGGQFNLDGGTLRFSAFKNNLLNSNGRLEPGRPIGNANIFGNYTQGADATLAIDIEGVLSGQSDAVGVDGNAILDGTLEVQFLNDFVPVIGNDFTILQTSAGNVGGTFTALNFPVLDGKTLEVAYEPKAVKLVVVAAQANTLDLDSDGDVDGVDFLLIQRTNPALIPDWQTQYGANRAAELSQAAAIPEPSTWAMLLLGAAVLCRQVARWRACAALPAIGLVLVATTSAHAGMLVWDGSEDVFWHNPFNWTPGFVPGDGDDAVIPSPASGTIRLNTDAVDSPVDSVTFNGGTNASFNTNGFRMRIAGDGTDLSDGRLRIEEGGRVFVADVIADDSLPGLEAKTVSVGSGGTFSNTGYSVVDRFLDVLPGGTVASIGVIEMGADANGAVGERALVNDGTISVGTLGAGTLQLLVDGDALIDLDGVTDAGIVRADADNFIGSVGTANLIVGGQLSDPFSGQMQIGRDDIIRFDRPWELDGSLQFLGGLAPDRAVLLGSPVTAIGAAAIHIASGEAVIAAPLTMEDGDFSVDSGTTVSFTARTNFGPDADFEVGGDVALHILADTRISQPSLTLDSVVGGRNTIELGANTYLQIDGDHADEFDDTISLTTNSTLTLNGNFVFGPNASLTFGKASTLNVNGFTRLRNNVHLAGTSPFTTVNIAAGAELLANGRIASNLENSFEGHLVNRGTLTVDGPGFVWLVGFTGTLELIDEGDEPIVFGDDIRNHGVISGTGLFEVNVENKSAGRIDPGDDASTGRLRWDDTQLAMFTESTLAFDIGGREVEATYDRIDARTVSLGGNLELSLVDSFVPAVTDVFAVLDAAELSGVFENIANGERLETMDGLGSFLVNYGASSAFAANQIVLSDFQLNPLTADMDNDGDVDGFDFLIIQRSNPDLLPTWQAEYGAIASFSSSQSFAVPEPSMWAMLVLGVAVSLHRRGMYRVLGRVAPAFTLMLVAISQPATATQIFTYTFDTTTVGNANGQADSKFSYVQQIGDSVLTRDELIGGNVRFLVDGQESTYGDFVAEDSVFLSLPLSLDGTIDWDQLADRTGVASTAGPPPSVLGRAGGAIGSNPFTGSIFTGHWLLDARDATDFDADGGVDGADFLNLQRFGPWAIPEWATNYGEDNSISLNSNLTAVVPESATWALLLFSAIGWSHPLSRGERAAMT